MPTKKIEKLADDLYFRAKSEKIEMVKKYCRDHKIDLFFVAENIPEKEFDSFDKFLYDNEILEE